jgi:L-fucose dehydrogenase
MDLGLKNKVIIVTGSASGIIEGIVRVLSEEGAVIAMVGRSREDNQKLQNKIVKSGGDLFSLETELDEPAACEKAVEAIVQKYGRIEGLVNNAGPDNPVLPESGNDERFMESLRDKLVHYYLMAQCALPYLKISKGAIVNVNPKTAVTGQDNNSVCAAADGGRNALTREWAVELLKYSIRVNAVIVSAYCTPEYESWIRDLKNPNENIKEIIAKISLETKMTKPLEIAHVVAFLLSGKSSHTTGQLIHVDGGNVHLVKAPANT